MTDAARNPLLQDWSDRFGVPPFGQIADTDFRPAFDAALAAHGSEIEAIARRPEPPSFGNTIIALEQAGRLLDRTSSVFHCLAGANTNDALQEIEREIQPRLAAHFSRIYLDEALFGRVDAVFAARDSLGLSAEQGRVLARYHLAFRRAGAHLAPAAKARLAAIAERLAALGTAFSQNVLADEQAYALVLDGEADLAALPDFLRDALREAGEERGMPGRHVMTLSRSLVEPFLQFSARRDLREKVFRAFAARGEGGGKTDNAAVIAEMVALRGERARLLGYPTFAHYRLDDSMAKTPEAVRGLLDTVWPLARARAMADRDELQELARAEGGNFPLAPWDWRFYEEKLRKLRHDLDEAAIKPYFQLERMIEAAFDTATRLFGLTFAPLADIPVWHPDVRVWEVRDRTGRHMGLFFGDYFARSSKQGGAWMTTLREQEKLSGPDTRPLVLNIMNFNKAPDGQPSLLSFDDARTLFHEFGHALHGLLTDVTYPMISGTSVLTDFVELPSQLYEHWLERPEVLRRFAIHAETGQPIPEEMLKRLLAARNFGQGFGTVEYVASALVDLDLHARPETADFDAAAFEKASLARIGMPDEIAMRHRLPHFGHIFSGGGYAAAYYSYMWSEVLDADAFGAFEEAGDIFDPATARRLHDAIYASGGSREPEDAYLAFRGKLPTPDALLMRRGLIETPPAAQA